MKGILLACCVSLACASKFTVGSGVDAIVEQIQSLRFEGRSRDNGKASGVKSGVEALLKTVRKVEKFDDPTRAVLQQVSDLLQDILDFLIEDRDTEQGSLDAVTDLVAACVQSAVRSSVASKKTSRDTARTNHTQCRSDESTDFDIYWDECRDLVNVIDGFPSLDCVASDPATREYSQEWATFLTAIENWFDTATAELNNPDDHVTDCTNAANTLDAKITECKGEQEIFESLACAYAEAQKQMCDTEDTCYGNQIAAHEAARIRVFGEAAVRMQDAKMVHYIKCLVDTLVAQEADTLETMIANCESAKTDDYSLYNNTDVPDPAQPTCEVVNHHPSDSSWDATEYGSLARPAADLSITCDV